MDKIIAYAGEKGMRVVLDHHRSTAGAGTSENGLWYNSQYTEDQWVSDWQMLATRYKGTTRRSSASICTTSPTTERGAAAAPPTGPARPNAQVMPCWPSTRTC